MKDFLLYIPCICFYSYFCSKLRFSSLSKMLLSLTSVSFCLRPVICINPLFFVFHSQLINKSYQIYLHEYVKSKDFSPPPAHCPTPSYVISVQEYLLPSTCWQSYSFYLPPPTLHSTLYTEARVNL